MEFQTIIWRKKGSAPRGNRCKIKFATLNVQGITMIGRRQEIEKWMEKKG